MIRKYENTINCSTYRSEDHSGVGPLFQQHPHRRNISSTSSVRQGTGQEVIILKKQIQKKNRAPIVEHNYKWKKVIARVYPKVS